MFIFYIFWEHINSGRGINMSIGDQNTPPRYLKVLSKDNKSLDLSLIATIKKIKNTNDIDQIKNALSTLQTESRDIPGKDNPPSYQTEKQAIEVLTEPLESRLKILETIRTSLPRLFDQLLLTTDESGKIIFNTKTENNLSKLGPVELYEIRALIPKAKKQLTKQFPTQKTEIQKALQTLSTNVNETLGDN